MGDSKASIFIILAGMLAAGFFFMLALGGGCDGVGADDDRGREILEQQGYEDIHMTGYAPFQCGEGDVSSSGFEATAPNGARVEGVVCCGLAKRCTVRF